jgi:hypothetical protein
VLLSKEPNAIDHLLRPLTRSCESLGQPRVLTLEKLHPLGRYHALYTGRLEGLESGFGLQCATAKRRQLVTKVLDQLLELRKSGSFRTYAV